EVEAADVEVALLVDGGGAREEVALQGCGGDVVIRRHGDAGYGSVRASRRRRDRCGWARTTIVPCSCTGTGTPAPVAQRIEHRPPEPVAQVRVLPGRSLCRGRSCAGGALPPAKSRDFERLVGDCDVRPCRNDRDCSTLVNMVHTSISATLEGHLH